MKFCITLCRHFKVLIILYIFRVSDWKKLDFSAFGFLQIGKVLCPIALNSGKNKVRRDPGYFLITLKNYLGSGFGDIWR